MKMLRDIVVTLAALAVLGFVADHFVTQNSGERQRAARLAQIRQQINTLEAVYKASVFNDGDLKGIYQQIFRQNEILLEYQKLLLTSAFERPDEALLTPALIRK